MTQEHHDEVDLVYVIKKIKEIVKGWIVLLFKAIGFAIKYWYIILGLIIIGFAYGYYLVQQRVPSQKSTVVVKVNYELQPYVKNAVELYNSKAKNYDSIFLTGLGFNRYNPQVKEIMLEPIIDFKDITEEYQINERSLDMILNRMEFPEEKPLSEILEIEYDYYKFDISLSGYANKEHVLSFFEYINNDPQLEVYKTEAKKNLMWQIDENDKSLALINGVFESYVISENTSGTPVDKGFDLNSLMESKLIVQDRNKILKDELAVSGDIIVPVEEPKLRTADGRFLHKKHIIYPFILVFGFFFVAYLRYLYIYLRNVARENS